MGKIYQLIGAEHKGWFCLPPLADVYANHHLPLLYFSSPEI
jgi:hypothetical protein